MFFNLRGAILGTLIVASSSTFAQKEEVWNWDRVKGELEKYTPKAPTNVQKDTLLNMRLSGNPKSLNPIISSNDNNSSVASSNLYATLFGEDGDTLIPFPYLAESITISPDNKKYTIKLNKEAKWQDGTSVTADDLVYSINITLDEKTDAASQRSYMEGWSIKKIDELTAEITIPEPKFDTFRTIYLQQPIQKKQFENEKDVNKAPGVMNPIGNGPWKVAEFKSDQYLKLERVENWWGSKLPMFKNTPPYKYKMYHLITEDNLAYERWIGGQLDYYNALNPQQFFDKVRGVDKARVGTSPKDKQSVWADFMKNNAPRGYSYIGWNLKNPIFQSVKTRQALSRLVNYKEISEKIFRGQQIQSTSPFGSLSLNAAPELRDAKNMLTYNFKEAAKLLKEDGWADTDKNNILDKVIDGKKVQFEFTLKTNSNNNLRVQLAQLIQQDFKKAGIKMNLSPMEWNAFLSDVDNRKFDALILAWTATPYPNPKQIWHTDSEANQGSNFGSYSNKKVDELIEKANITFNPTERNKIMQEINRHIYADQPYTFLTESIGVNEGYNSKLHIINDSWITKFNTSSDNDRFYISQ